MHRLLGTHFPALESQTSSVGGGEGEKERKEESTVIRVWPSQGGFMCGASCRTDFHKHMCRWS